MNRTIQPPILPINDIIIPDPEQITFPNGIPLYYLNIGDENVVRMDIVVRSGKWDAVRALETEFTALMLKEGALSLSSSQIAEKLDYYGAWLQTYTTQQRSYLTLYSLNKFFSETLSVAESIIKNPTFPKKELETLLLNRKRQFSVDKDKVQYLAGRKFLQSLFGSDHPYGRMAEEADYDTLSAQDLIDYYSSNYGSGNVEIVLFGKIEHDMIRQIESSFGKTGWGDRFKRNNRFYIERPANEKEIFVAKPDAVQSAVCIGKKAITRDHPDFHGLSILNVIFGGYFGSRLMSNIREDKGYTYGIYSSLTSHLHAGYMNISTQTGNENVHSVIHEVFAEMDRLQNEPVPEDELQTVRNYLLGESARRFDSPFALADAYLGLREFELEKNFYEQRIDTIKNITSSRLQDLAARYFTPADFRTVVAGKE